METTSTSLEPGEAMCTRHIVNQPMDVYTVEPLYNGHIGAGQFVRYKEVSFIGRLVQECICNSYYHVMKYYTIHVHVHS